PARTLRGGAAAVPSRRAARLPPCHGVMTSHIDDVIAAMAAGRAAAAAAAAWTPGTAAARPWGTRRARSQLARGSAGEGQTALTAIHMCVGVRARGRPARRAPMGRRARGAGAGPLAVLPAVDHAAAVRGPARR